MTPESAARGDRLPRAPRLLPADLSPAQLDLYRTLTEGPRSSGPTLFRIFDDDGALLGPFANLLHAPGVGTALQQVGVEVRYGTDLSARSREIAILTVAAHWQSAYEVYAHEAVGRACGLTEEVLAGLAEGDRIACDDPVEQATWELTRAMLAGVVDDATWARCVPPLTLRQVLELSTLVGYYSTLALQMRVFDNDGAPHGR